MTNRFPPGDWVPFIAAWRGTPGRPGLRAYMEQEAEARAQLTIIRRKSRHSPHSYDWAELSEVERLTRQIQYNADNQHTVLR